MKNFLSKTFLFDGLSDALLDDLLQNQPPYILEFRRGDLIYPTNNTPEGVGFVLNGRCEIRRTKSDGGRVVLNILGENDSFGILSIFSEEKFPTQIYASVNCKILFFSREKIIHFVNNYSQISINLIKFLTSRVNFLNNKIATFSSDSVDEKLAAFLLYEVSRFKCCEFPFNVKKTAEEISVGRASVYRSISLFESNKIIKFNNKKIFILDLEGLERITK